MAISLNINICNKSCTSLVFTEITKSFSSTNNTGWGSPNELTSDAVKAELIIITPANSTYTFDLFSNGFPTTDTIKEFIILPTDIGYIDKILDGKYTITYNVTTSGTNYSKSITYYNICNLECCISSMNSDIEDISCDCSKEALDKYIEAYSVLLGLKHKLICGNLEDFDKIYKYTNSLCINNKCKNC